MALLVNLTTNLKSLKYGGDRPGNGNSGQPYIKSKIPNQLTFKSPDFLLRNGLLAPVSAAEDVVRLGKMFFDLKSPNGLLFTAKQNVLSNSAVRTQTSGVLNEGIYTPLSTLAQAGVVAFGGHLNKQGTNPFEQTGAYANNNNLYATRIKNYNQEWLNSPDNSKLKNRLFALYESKIQNNPIGLFSKINNISDLPSNILTYKGGPGAPLGVGFTSIRFADQRTGKNNLYSISGATTWTPSYSTIDDILNYRELIDSSNPKTGGVAGKWNFLTSGSLSSFNFSPPSVYKLGNDNKPTLLENNDIILYANGSATYTQKQIEESPYEKEENNTSRKTGAPILQDFRKIIRENPILPKTARDKATKNGSLAESLDYTSQNYEKRVNIGGKDNAGPGNNTSNKNLSKGLLTPSGIGPIDKINALPLYRSREIDLKQPTNDLIQFRIAAIENDNPQFNTYIHFRAFIDSFDDAYTADWGSIKYTGRGENFYNYNGFDRNISLSFTVAAQSLEELKPMYKKLNYLASNLTPDYSQYGYMRGPLVKLTVGNYLYEQVGFIKNLSYSVPSESPWDINNEMPFIIKVNSFSFIPIHSFRPQKQQIGLKESSSINFNAPGVATTFGDQRYIYYE